MKDATIEIIGEVRTHPDADRLDLVKIMGYQCVTQRGLYQGGEKIVYIKPDALLPVELWTEEYRKYSPKRIKAVRLRGEWSEGCIVPFSILPNGNDLISLEEGTDVSELIGVTHWEAPTPNDIQAKGSLPYSIPKTDEDRFESEKRLPIGVIADIGIKIDGQSCLSENTIIKTEDGLKTIKEICESKYKGKVKSYNTITGSIEYKNITNTIIQNNNDDWYEIEIESGEKLILTSDHRVYLPELDCYRMVKDLLGSEKLIVI